MAPLDGFGPATRAWFESAFVAPTPVQRQGWPLLQQREHALLLAPTGTGKTLAAFLACVDRLTRAGPAASPGFRVLYVSPLKALVYDVERNLRAPLLGVQRAAEGLGVSLRQVRVDVRTGDTPQRDRRRQLSDPGDILVTTPESLFLLLTSQARDNLRAVETVIVDEIHALAGSKRGVHLALSLERLSALADEEPQRIGLSATQRPLERIRAYLGGARPVALVDASAPPALSLEVKVPVEEMQRPPPMPRRPGAKAKAPQHAEHGIWPSLYPVLLAEIRSHRSTILFANSRLLCERLAQKLNELAGEELVRAHHGSISHEKRAEIEELLKSGQLPAIVATSSLELGIDMGAVDLVLLVESPGTVSSGLQRVGRAGHGVGQTSRGVVYPKFRGDLLEATVVVEGMLQGDIEETRPPKNCLDVLAQQVVAIVAMEAMRVDDLLALVRRASPYDELSRDMLVSVLDMLTGRYPSDDFAYLVPCLNWDRVSDVLTPRRSARTLAIMNAGTIPDRGLYRVQLGSDGARLGELDEEMVYETRQGDTIILGASAWRVEDVQQDRVIVSPAPGQPGRLPFWRGERAGRPLEVGRAIGALLREMADVPPDEVDAWLAARAPLDELARKNLAAYVAEQRAASGVLPDDKTLVVERFRDELGDWRLCILTPFGQRLHAPWALALEARLSARAGFDVQILYSDDGIALQLADTGELPPLEELFPDPEVIEELLVSQLGHSALFAARFRENAARALLLPRRRIGARAPLWLQRRRSQQLLAVARQHPGFPIVLETYRECLQDVFDVPSLLELLAKVRSREVRVREVETASASPFARSLVFQYVAAYLYDGDAPLAERKAAALSLDRGLLAELLGQEELRDLLVPEAVAEVERELAFLDQDLSAEHEDHVHDLLRRLGDLREEEVLQRSAAPPAGWLRELEVAHRALRVPLAGEERWIAAEDAARYRDALGLKLPPGLPSTFLEESDRPLAGLLRRYARTHGPFRAEGPAARFGLAPAVVEEVLRGLELEGGLVRANLSPGVTGQEWCDAEVLRRLKRRSLARLRSEVAPVDEGAFARFALAWHGLGERRSLVEVVEPLEGVPLAFSDLEQSVLPARVASFEPRHLDELGASGALVWVGKGALGARDGRVALYRRASAPLLLDDVSDAEGALEGAARELYGHIEARGASFLTELQAAMKLPSDQLLVHLWELVWAGLVTNDTFQPLRGLGRRSRRKGPSPVIGGRWSPVKRLRMGAPSPTERAMARAQALLERHGVVSREAAGDEVGGFSALYPVLRALEEAGRVRRGHFVEGLGGAQFALAGAVDRLRSSRARSSAVHVLAASDPASPWGSLLPWPGRADGVRPRRLAGAQVILVDGEPLLFVERGGHSLVTFPRADEDAAALAKAVAALKERRGFRSLRVARVDGEEALRSARAAALLDAGFERDYRGLVLGR
jgi:ATP-dependent helicase Lhr and Lhr-like helicase